MEAETTASWDSGLSHKQLISFIPSIPITVSEMFHATTFIDNLNSTASSKRHGIMGLLISLIYLKYLVGKTQMCRVQDLTVTKIDLNNGIESMDFHTGTDTPQYSIPDNGTKVCMTLPVCEQQSIPV